MRGVQVLTAKRDAVHIGQLNIGEGDKCMQEGAVMLVEDAVGGERMLLV
jgi:hypothetical protein